MAFFNARPTKPLVVALRCYWMPFALFALEPFAALLVATAVDFPGARALTAIPASLCALWPAAFKDAPVAYWLLACACWFAATLAVVSLSSGVVGA